MKKTMFLLFLLSNLFENSGYAQSGILILGDSHGAAEIGWVKHLQQLRPNDRICNLSIAGNTIGFDNLGRDSLNTIKNIHSYIERGKNSLGKIDKILILLGTNDCKSVFKDSLLYSVSQFDKLLKRIKSEFENQTLPQIIYITPPPFATDEKLTEKYVGGNSRLKILIPKLMIVAKKNHVKCINLNKILGKKISDMTTDGVHFSTIGYESMAKKTYKYL